MKNIFNFKSYDNSKQNNTVIIKNDIDEILEALKEINLLPDQIHELKIAIEKDTEEVKQTNSLGTNVKNWCSSLFEQIATSAIVNVSLPIVQTKLQNVLYAIYHFPIQF